MYDVEVSQLCDLVKFGAKKIVKGWDIIIIHIEHVV